MALLRNCILFLGIMTMSGCRIELSVPAEGSVASQSGAYDCAAGQTCSIEVNDLFFDETFIAQPRSGLMFSGWKKGKKLLCGGKLTPCRLFTAGFVGHEGLLEILESDEFFYLQPTFIEDDAIRRYRPGDRVILSGTLAVEEGSAPAVLVQARAIVDIIAGVYSHADKEVLGIRKTVINLANGERQSDTSHFWQEENGALFDINDEDGNYYLDAGTSKYGVDAIPAPLVSFSNQVLQFYTLFPGHTSGPVTTGTRSIAVGDRQTIEIPMGAFQAFPVTVSDSYVYNSTYAEHQRGSSITRMRVLWVSQAKGVIQVDTVEREYTATGRLQRTRTLHLQATRTSF